MGRCGARPSPSEPARASHLSSSSVRPHLGTDATSVAVNTKGADGVIRQGNSDAEDGLYRLDAPISCLIHALAPNSAYEEDVGGQATLCGRLRLITLIVYAYALHGDARRVIN